MIISSFFSSVEFYVIAVVIAAAIVGLCVKPSQKGAAKTYIAEGTLSASATPAEPSIEIMCLDDGRVSVTRRGLQGMSDESRINFFVTIIGFDITIEERCAPSLSGNPADEATISIGALGCERYHMTYRADTSGLIAASYFRNKPGICVTKPLV